MNYINASIDNFDVNGDYCYMKSSTVSVIINHISIDYTNKIDGISTNMYLMENNGLPYGVDVDDVLPASAPNKYGNIKYNYENHILQVNGNI